VRTISRYFIARFVQFSLAVVFVAAVSISVIELLLNFDKMLAFRDGPGGIPFYLGLRLAAEYASFIVPIAAFLGAFLSLSFSAYSLETLALRAGGVPISRVAWPLLACGLLASFTYAAFHEGVIVEARRAWVRERDGDVNIRFKSGSFWYHRGSRIYNVGHADRKARSLHDVFVYERNAQGLLVRQIEAERIDVLDAKNWRFRNARVRHFDPANPLAPPRIENWDSHVAEVADPRDQALLNADPATLGMKGLLQFVRGQESVGRNADEQRRIIHERITDWVALALLVAMAIPLALSVERTRSMGRSAAYAVAALAGYYALRSVAKIVSAFGVGIPGLTSWALIAVLALSTALGLLRARR